MTDLGTSISLNASRFAAGIAETRRKLTELNTAFVENKRKMQELNAEAKELQKQEQALTREMQNGGTAQQREQLQQLRDRMAQVNAQIGSLRTQERELQHDIRQTNNELQQQRESAGSLSEAFGALGQLFAGLGVAQVCREMAAAFNECVKAAEDFEATMSTVEALSGATASQMEELTDKAKELGATTKFTATESAQAMTYMGMAGWNAEQMLAGMDGVMSLAAASGSDLAMTADIVTDNLTAFGMKAEEVSHFADVLAATATNSNTSVEIMGETFKNSAAVAGALGYSIEDVAVAVGLMANAGVKGTIAGTALKNTFNGLLQGAKLTSEAFGEVEISAVNADGTMKDFGETMNELRGYFEQMSQAERVTNAMDIAGKYGYNGLLAIVNSTQEDFDKLTASINDCEGAASKMADVKMDNLHGQVTLMNSAMDALKTTVGEAFQDELRELAKVTADVLTKVNDFLKKHPTVTKAIISITAAVTGLVGAFATFAAVSAAVEAVKKFTAATKLATEAQRAFNLVAKANPYILLASAIAGVIVLLQDLVENAKDASEQAEELSNNIKELSENARQVVDEQKQLEKIISEYKEIDSSISDVTEKKEKLSSLQEELNSLYEGEKKGIDLVNRSYNEQIDLLKQLSDVEIEHRKNELNAFREEAQEEVSKLEKQWYNIEFKYDISSSTDVLLKDKINEIISEGSSLVNQWTGEAQEVIDDITFSINDGLINLTTKGDIDQQISTLERLENAILSTGEASGRFADMFEAVGGRLSILKKAKGDVSEIDDACESLSDSIINVNQETGYATDSFKELANAIKSASPDELTKQIDDLTKSADSLVKEYGTLYDSLNKLRNGETLNYDQMQSLLKIYPELAKYIKVTADGYTIETEALDDLADALDDNLQKRIEHERQATLETLRGYEERKKIIEREIATSAQAAANDPMARAAYDAAMSKLKEADGEISQLYAKLDTWDSTPAYLASGKGKASKTDGKKDTKEKEPPGLKSLISYAKTASQAFDEMNEKGELTYSTVQALIDAGYESALEYDEAANKWTISAEKYRAAAAEQIKAAKGVEGVTETEKTALDSLARSLDDVVNRTKEETKELLTLSGAGDDMEKLSAAVAEQNKNGGLSAKTVSSLSGTKYKDAFDITAEGTVRLKPEIVKKDLEKEIDDSIKALEEELKTAEEGDIHGIKAQIQAFQDLKKCLDDVAQGLYGIEQEQEKIVGDEALKAIQKQANERLYYIDEELKAKQELRDETLKAIDDEVQARKRLTEDNDIQNQIDQVTAQLKFSQLDEFSQLQLQRKLEQLQKEKADLDWSRGIEDRRAQVNSDYDAQIKLLNEEKEGWNNAIAVLNDLNGTVADGTAEIKEALTDALDKISPEISPNITFNSAQNFTDQQIVDIINRCFGTDFKA